MEKKMNYNLMLSLKEICFRRVVVILWTRTCTIASFYAHGIEYKVKEDMKKLDLPRLLAEQMTYVVEPIQSEITDWTRFHGSYLSISFENLVKNTFLLCWTNLGTVDHRKSAERLIKYKMLDVIQCYKLACIYCLEDFISALWENLPEESKRYFYKEEGPSRDTKLRLEFCWPYILKGEETKLNNMFETPMENFNQYAFEYSACKGSKAATEYFYRKLTHAEREVSLFRAVTAVLVGQSDIIFYTRDPISKLARFDIFWYFLSLMSPERQMEIFKKYPYQVLLNFLQWPWQDMSLDMEELIWPYLTANDYARALEMISIKVKSGFNLTKMFRMLFLNGNSDFRKCFIKYGCLYGVSLQSFFKVEDSETIRIIFRAVDSEDRKKLVFSRRVLKHFYKLILRGKYDMIQLCLHEANLSDEEKEGLKEAFLRVLTEMERLRKKKLQGPRTIKKILSLLEVDGRQNEGASISLTDSEIDAKYINSGDYIWKQFLHIVEEGNAKIPGTITFDEEDMGCPSSDSDFDFDDD